MKPMGLNSTQFISYRDIRVEDVDLFEDAWGFKSAYYDVISFLGHDKIEPGRDLTKKLFEKIRKQH
jgi:hypothetical protein